jgi:hypothetical protein
MFNSFEIKKSSRAIKDCVWPSAKKSIEGFIKELEAEGKVNEAYFAKKRYLGLKAEDVSIEPVREWTGKPNKVCLVARKTGIARMDLEVEPLPLDEVLKEFGWEIETVAGWEDIRAMVPTAQSETKLFKVGTTGQYASFMSGLIPPDTPNQIHPNSTIVNWGGDIFFRELVADLSATAPIENLGTFYKLQISDTGIESPTVVYVVNTDQTVGTGIFSDMVFPSATKLPDQDKQYNDRFTRQFGIDLKYLGDGKDYNGLHVKDLVLTSKFGQDNVHLEFHSELDFTSNGEIDTGTFEMKFWAPWPVDSKDLSVPAKIVFEYNDSEGIARTISIPFHLNLSNPDPDKGRFGTSPTTDRGNGYVGIQVIDHYSQQVINVGNLDTSVFKTINFAGQDIPVSYNKVNNELVFRPPSPYFGPVTMALDPKATPPVGIYGEVDIDWTKLRMVTVKSSVPITVDGFGFLSSPAFVFEIPGIGIIPFEHFSIIGIRAHWEESSVDDQHQPVFKQSDVLKLNSYYITPFRGDNFVLKGNLSVEIKPNTSEQTFQLETPFTVWDGIYTRGFSASEFNAISTTISLSGEYMGIQVAEVEMNPPCNIVPVIHAVGEKNIFGFTLKDIEPSYEFIGQGVSVGAMFLYDGLEKETSGAVIAQKSIPVNAPYQADPATTRFDEAGNKFHLGYVQRSLIDTVDPTVRVSRAYTTDGRAFEINELTGTVDKVEGDLFHITVVPKTPPVPGEYILINKIEVEFVGPLGVYSKHVII